MKNQSEDDQTNHPKNGVVALYIRVSTAEQAKEGYSIGEQTERLKLYADAHGWRNIKVYTDAGYSGASLNRPALQELISNISNISRVLVYKLDRLSRSQKDTLHLIEDVFTANGCAFESMSERFDTSSAFGKATVGMLAVFAQLEREQIKERLMMGIDARVKEGKWRGGKIPFGYIYNSENDTLTIDKQAAEIVKSIFSEYARGKSLRGIETNFFLLFPQKQTYTKSLRYILKNKTYCGFMRRNGQWIKGNHEAIIDEETYNKVNTRLEENHRRYVENGSKARSRTSTNLGGLIYCAHCGARYGKNKAGNKKYGITYHYSCYSRSKRMKAMIRDEKCKNKTYAIEELDNIIFDEIRKLKLDPAYLKKPAETTNRRSIIENQIKAIGNQISKLMDQYSIGTISIEEITEKTELLTKRRQKLQEELKALIPKQQQSITKLVDSFEEALENGTLEERRTIIEQLIEKIVIDGDNITIHWKFK